MAFGPLWPAGLGRGELTAWLDAASITRVGVGHSAPAMARRRGRRGLGRRGAAVPPMRCRGMLSRCSSWHHQGPLVGQHGHSRGQRQHRGWGHGAGLAHGVDRGLDVMGSKRQSGQGGAMVVQGVAMVGWKDIGAWRARWHPWPRQGRWGSRLQLGSWAQRRMARVGACRGVGQGRAGVM